MNDNDRQLRRQGPLIIAAKPAAAAVAAVEPMPADEPVNKIEVVICAVVAMALFVGIYLVPRPIGDLYVAFAGAQDILHGKLGKIDDWSFANHQVWVDQNWGTHLLYYGAYHFGGPTGILLLKAAILLLMGAGVFLAVRQHRASVPVAMLVAGAVMIAGNAYLDLRPNLISLTYCPIFYWLLLRTRPQPHRIWVAVAFLWLWANMHGGFIFGYALLGIWCALRIIDMFVKIEREDFIRKSWPYFAAPLIGFALIAFANPFGFENITHPFVVGGSLEWRKVAEWFPVFNTEEVGYGSRIEFFIAVGVLGGLGTLRPLLKAMAPERFGQAALGDLVLVLFSVAVCGLVVQQGFPALNTLNRQIEQRNSAYDGAIEQVNSSNLPSDQKANRVRQYTQMRISDLDSIESLRQGTIYPLGIFLLLLVLTIYSTIRVTAKVIANWTSRHSAGPPSFGLDFATLLFALALGGMVIYMGFSARRFVPLAIIMMAPLLAIHLDWVFQKLRFLRPLPVIVVAVAILVPTVTLTAKNIKHYLPGNPYYPPEMSSVFDRMIFNEAYGHGAAEFINRNNISGNAFEEWRWEGFLHWRCPQLKLFVGGRAQQAYSEATYIHRMELWSGHDHFTGKPLDRVKELARMNVRLVIIPLQNGAEEFIKPLLAPESPWTMLFIDVDMNVILADTSDPALARTVDKAVAGELWYPDEATAALSRAMCMSYRPGILPEKRRDALVLANLKIPTLLAYHRLLDMASSGEATLPWMLDYLRGEFVRLGRAGEGADPHALFNLMRVQHRVGELIFAVSGELPVSARPSQPELEAMMTQMQEILARLREMQRQWAG